MPSRLPRISGFAAIFLISFAGLTLPPRKASRQMTAKTLYTGTVAGIISEGSVSVSPGYMLARTAMPKSA